ncbi:hypothetical protein HA466_0137910 [Hirschfeldia incana]|nr:hypothetical protein HA466_0137910 [Hirschfeldia incana]
MHTHKITDICNPLAEHLYIYEHFFYFEEDVTSHEIFFEFSVCGNDKWVIKECGVNYDAKEEIHEGNSSDCEAKEEINEADVTSSGLFFELLTNDCGMNYGDCEAEEETNEADVTSPGLFFEFLTNEAGEGTNEGDCAERKRKMDQDGDTSLVVDNSKYASNSGAGCSKSMVIEMGLDGGKVLKAIHEHESAFLPSEISDVVLELGINGDYKAEEDLNGNDSAETKKRKRESPFTFVDKNSTSEVGNNGDCETDEEVNGNDTAKTKKSRLSL